jgi:hypothetical protein
VKNKINNKKICNITKIKEISQFLIYLKKFVNNNIYCIKLHIFINPIVHKKMYDYNKNQRNIYNFCYI